LRVQRILVQISAKRPHISLRLPENNKLMLDFKKTVIFLVPIIANSKHVQQFCEGLHIFCTNFLRFGPDFHQIKNFGGAVAPLHHASYISELKSKNLQNGLFKNNRQKNAYFMDDASKTRGIKLSNIETWLLFAATYQNSWLRACSNALHYVLFCVFLSSCVLQSVCSYYGLRVCS